MVSRFLHTLALILAVCSLSCKESQPTEPQNSRLTLSEQSLTIAVSYDRYIVAKGGQGPIHIKSISDSGIVSTAFGTPYLSGKEAYQDVRFWGLKIGTVNITLEDSAKISEATIRIDVAVMAASSNTVTVKERNSATVSILGGNQPYSIVQQPNAGIATVMISSNIVLITAEAQGNTSVTIRDSDTPAHTATVLITVTPIPVFTSAGQISFNSNAGDLSLNGIYTEDFIDAPANSQGAGGWLQGSDGFMIDCEITAYKKKSKNIIDVMIISFERRNFGAGLLPVNSKQNRIDSVYVWFVIDGDITSPTADIQILSGGSMSLTSFTKEHVSGTFSGTGTLIKNLVPVPTQQLSVTNGTFSIPLLLEDFSVLSAARTDRKRVAEFVDRIRPTKRNHPWEKRENK